jgi:hypothetical protein
MLYLFYKYINVKQMQIFIFSYTHASTIHFIKLGIYIRKANERAHFLRVAFFQQPSWKKKEKKMKN